MRAPRYSTARYWTERYWPPVEGAGGGGTSATVAVASLTATTGVGLTRAAGWNPPHAQPGEALRQSARAVVRRVRAAVSDLPWATAAGEARVTVRGCAAASDIRHAQAVSDRAVTITKDDDLLLLLGLFDADSA